jgi:hypothetical protein
LPLFVRRDELCFEAVPVQLCSLVLELMVTVQQVVWWRVETSKQKAAGEANAGWRVVRVNAREEPL